MKKIITLVSLFISLGLVAQDLSIYGTNEAPDFVTDSIYSYVWDNGAQSWLLTGKTADMSYSNYQLNSEIEYSKAGNEWQRSKFHTISYNGDGLPTLELFMSYGTNTWVNDIMIKNTWEGQNQTEKTIQNWNGLFWLNDKKFVSTYDASGNRLTFLSQTGTAENHWINVNLVTSTYTDNKLMTELNEQWFNGEWVKSSKKEYEYLNGLLASKTEQLWVNNAWGSDVKTSYTYNNDGKLTSMLVQRLSGTTWNNRSLTEYMYDANGLLTTWLFKEWDGTVWFDTQKELYTYTNGNLTHTLYQIMKGDAWVDYEEESFEYNESGYLTDHSQKLYDAETVIGERTHHYLRSVVGIEETLAGVFSVYPNPTTGKVAIKANPAVSRSAPVRISDIEVITLDGNTIIRQSGGNLIDLTGAPAGTYILRFRADGRQYAKPVIMLHE